jgi:hypothetical protein
LGEIFGGFAAGDHGLTAGATGPGHLVLLAFCGFRGECFDPALFRRHDRILSLEVCLSDLNLVPLRGAFWRQKRNFREISPIRQIGADCL